jgi:hypothetical protein
MAERVRELPPRVDRSSREEKKEVIKKLMTNMTMDIKRKVRGLVAVRVPNRVGRLTGVVSFKSRTAWEARSRRRDRE